MKLIGYLSNGYPSMEQSVELSRIYALAGCDQVQVDLPARDPYLEGPLIAERMAVALRNCDDYENYLENLVRISEALGGTDRILLLAYVTTIKEIGVDRFIQFCIDHGFFNLTVVGLEDESVKARLMSAGLKISCYVQRKLDEAEVTAAKDSNGFVYLQAASTEINGKYPELRDCVEFLRSEGITRPIYCGVGISTTEDFESAKEAGADGAFVGSSILRVSKDPEELQRVIAAFASVK